MTTRTKNPAGHDHDCPVLTHDGPCCCPTPRHAPRGRLSASDPPSYAELERRIKELETFLRENFLHVGDQYGGYTDVRVARILGAE